MAQMSQLLVLHVLVLFHTLVNWVKVNYDGIVTTSRIVSYGGIIWKHDRSMIELYSAHGTPRYIYHGLDFFFNGKYIIYKYKNEKVQEKVHIL
jgi:hypothetical protein